MNNIRGAFMGLIVLAAVLLAVGCGSSESEPKAPPPQPALTLNELVAFCKEVEPTDLEGCLEEEGAWEKSDAPTIREYCEEISLEPSDIEACVKDATLELKP